MREFFFYSHRAPRAQSCKRRTTERISTIARETKEWRLAKLAARFLAVTCSRVRGKEKEHGGKGKNREKEDLCLGLVKVCFNFISLTGPFIKCEER